MNNFKCHNSDDLQVRNKTDAISSHLNLFRLILHFNLLNDPKQHFQFYSENLFTFILFADARYNFKTNIEAVCLPSH